MAVLTQRGSLIRTVSFEQFDYSGQVRGYTPFDVAKYLTVGTTTVIYSYPMVTNERLALFDFTGLVCATGNPGANGMYKVVGRFARNFSGVNSQQGSVSQLVADATVGGYNITVGLSGSNVQISVTVPAGPDEAVARVVGHVYEIKAPIPP